MLLLDEKKPQPSVTSCETEGSWTGNDIKG